MCRERGTRGQPVILKTLALAQPDNIWITLQAGPSLIAPTCCFSLKTVIGWLQSHITAGPITE